MFIASAVWWQVHSCRKLLVYDQTACCQVVKQDSGESNGFCLASSVAQPFGVWSCANDWIGRHLMRDTGGLIS